MLRFPDIQRRSTEKKIFFGEFLRKATGSISIFKPPDLHWYQLAAGNLLARCQDVGPHTGAWALAMCQHRGIESIRVLQGLLALARKTPGEQLEPAAAKALQRAGWRLGDVKQALAEPANVVQVDFLSAHPLIRDMQAYQIPAP